MTPETVPTAGQPAPEATQHEDQTAVDQAAVDQTEQDDQGDELEEESFPAAGVPGDADPASVGPVTDGDPQPEILEVPDGDAIRVGEFDVTPAAVDEGDHPLGDAE